MQWSQGWVDAFLGLGALMHWLTPRLGELHAQLDYAGAAVVFLQRHRIELGLKTLLDCAGAQPADYNHSLDKLWAACAAALRPKHPVAWDAFAHGHYEFVEEVGKIDPGSFTFRYPVDKSGVPVERPIFVDPVVLESAGAAFEEGVEMWVHLLAVTADTENPRA